ncbi:MAG: globin domain-containing protein [Alphaproteobacteria bacterium]
MARQKAMLMGMLRTAVENLDRLDELSPAVEELGRRHIGYGVKEADYDTVGEALLSALEHGLGGDFSDDVRDAWSAVYGVLAMTMIAAAKEQVERAAA